MINQSNFLESDQDNRNQASFELNYLLQEMNRHQQSAPEVQKRRKNLAAKQRPKSTLQVDHSREGLATAKQHKKSAKGFMRAQLNHSLENL